MPSQCLGAERGVDLVALRQRGYELVVIDATAAVGVARLHSESSRVKL